MRIGDAIYRYGTTEPGLSAFISTRLYPYQAPQNPTLPMGVFTKIDGPRVQSHQGPSGHAHPRYQFDWYAESVAGSPSRSPVSGVQTVSAVAEAARIAFDGFKGVLGGWTYVSAIQLIDEREIFESDLKLFRISQDYIFWHDEESAIWRSRHN